MHSIIQMVVLFVYLLLQSLWLSSLFKRMRWKTTRSLKKKLGYLLASLIYVSLNLLVILPIIYFKPFYFWINNNSLTFLIYGVFVLGTLFSIPPLHFIVTFFVEVWHRKGFSTVEDFGKRKFIRKVFIGGIALGAPIAYTIVKEKENLEVVKCPIKINNLPDSLEGFKIIQITDIHSSFFVREDYLKEVVDKVNSLHGDVLALTGDFISHSYDKKYFPEVVRAFSQFNSSCKKYAVLGNHDFWTDPDFVEAGLKEAGINVLRNESESLAKSAHIIGIDDIWDNHHDVEKATSNISLDDFTIFLCHNPDYILEATEYKFNLMLSGHTHGGQVRFPFIGPLIVPSKFGKKYCNGLYKEKETFLYVNRGIGVSFPPVRVSCRPEITEITLTKV